MAALLAATVCVRQRGGAVVGRPCCTHSVEFRRSELGGDGVRVVEYIEVVGLGAEGGVVVVVPASQFLRSDGRGRGTDEGPEGQGKGQQAGAEGQAHQPAGGAEWTPGQPEPILKNAKRLFWVRMES